MSDSGSPAGGETSRPSRVFAPAGLVRPRGSRRVAGVCAAVGNCTGTDPLLWRVVFIALVPVAGLGLGMYVFGWLFFPAEGDESSGFMALVGRGSSSMSELSAAALSLMAIVDAMVVVAWGGGWPLVLLGVFGLSVIGLHRQGFSGFEQSAERPDMGTTADSGAGFSPYGPFQSSFAKTMVLDNRSSSSDTAVGAAAIPERVPSRPWVAKVWGKWRAESVGAPYTEPREYSVGVDESVTLRSDASGVWGSQVGHKRGAGTGTGSGAIKMGTSVGDTASQRRSRRRNGIPARRRWSVPVTLAGLLIALLALLVLSASGVSVPLTLTISVLLAVCSVGLLIGSGSGISALLMTLSTLLTVVLVGSLFLDRFDSYGYQEITVYTVDEIPDNVVATVGHTAIDLSSVDFGDEDIAYLAVSVEYGKLSIRVPENVDVTIDVGRLSAGNITLDGDGIAGKRRTDQLTSFGDDGEAGGGSLVIYAAVTLGMLQVYR